MSRYTVQDDPLCYPGTQVLRNAAGLTDQDQLDQFEHLMFLTRADEPLPPGSLDYAHYKAIHHHFFQDVYDWAGRTRTIRTGKGGNWFCYPEYIDAEMERLFLELGSEHHLASLGSPEQFAERASYYVAEINAVHPFREGNGRCQLTLLNILCELAGFSLHEDKIDPPTFLSAMISSFAGDNRALTAAIRSMVW
jgi:cell filamentation protein